MSDTQNPSSTPTPSNPMDQTTSSNKQSAKDRYGKNRGEKAGMMDSSEEKEWGDSGSEAMQRRTLDPVWGDQTPPVGTIDPSDPAHPNHPDHQKFYPGIDPAILPGGSYHPTRPQNPDHPDHEPQPDDATNVTIADKTHKLPGQDLPEGKKA
jgi:hypothetical protein